jgi:spore coat protein U-like protein
VRANKVANRVVNRVANKVNAVLKYSLWIGLCITATAVDLRAAVACEVSTSGAPFGSFDVISNKSRDTLVSVTMSCTGKIGESARYTIALSQGTNTSVTRAMRSGAGRLRYNLYSDSARTRIWGDGTSGSSTVGGSLTIGASPTTRVFTIYGRIPDGQQVAEAGAYIDSISVLVSY